MMMKLPVANLKLPVAGCQLPHHGGGTDIPVCVSDSKRKMPIQFTGNRQLTTSNFQGFTLVELIISIGLVLIIMLGVNFVFKMTSDTITAGQTLSETVRNNRAAQSVLQDDFAKYAPDGPSLLLRSQSQLAFRNRVDQEGDTDGNKATIDYDGDSAFTGPGENASPALPSQRSHRLDILSFFGKGKFSRATGGDVGRNLANSATADPTGPLISDMSANEAWIWYGHLVLPNNNGSFYLDNVAAPKTYPGVGTKDSNPNNFYASSWALGRLGHLLVEPFDQDSNSGTPDVIMDRASGSTAAKQVFIGRSPTANPDSSSPFTPGSTAYSQRAAGSTVSRGANFIYLRDSRYDLIGVSVENFQTIMKEVVRLAGATTDWWSEMMLSERFETNPALVRPISASAVAAQSPIFMQGCTQFIVEYAGDFVAQFNDPDLANFGQVSGAFNSPTPTTDGEIDFVVINNRKQIRWYGMPRDTSGDGKIPRAAANANVNQMVDVVPLRDMLTLAGAGNGPAIFEKDVNADLPTAADYAAPGALAFANSYTCAWGPADNVRPRMIRLTIVIDDPNGRLPDGQTYEYVFSLPPAE